MAARPWENRHIDHTKEGHQNLNSVKFLESKSKNVKMDGVSTKSPRPTASPTARIEKSEEKPKKGHRANGVNGNVPLPLPSPPPSAGELSPVKPDVQKKAVSPEKPSLRPETNLPTPLPPVETMVPDETPESDAVPPSPTDSSSFNHHLATNYPESNGGPHPASVDGTADHDLSCSGSCASEHGNNEAPSMKANPLDSPLSGMNRIPTQSFAEALQGKWRTSQYLLASITVPGCRSM